jgi:hypothetical protein
VLAKLREGDRGTVFGRRRWRTPWSSGTSGEPLSPGLARPTWAPKTTRSPWAVPSLPPAEPAVHAGGQPSATPTTSEAPSEEPSEEPSGAASTPTVKVIPPGVTASAGAGTAPGRTSAPGAPSSERPCLPIAGGSRESADPPSTRVIRIPAPVGVEHRRDSAPASSRAEPTRRRFPLIFTMREAPSVHAPRREQVALDERDRIAPAVIAVVVVCALLSGLAAFAATLGGGTSSSPGPAESIAPGGITASGGSARPGVSGAGAKHTGGSGHGGSGRGTAVPLRAPTGAARGAAGKP